MRFFRIVAGLLALYLIVVLACAPREAQGTAQKAHLEKQATAKAHGEHIHALLRYFSKLPEEELAPGYAERKVHELGSKHFAVREAAGKALIHMSWRAAAALRAVRENKDPEVRRRVAKCLTRIREERAWHQEYDWLREVIDAQPAGLNAALLHFLPFAADQETETVVYLAVYERCKRHPEERPALERYLTDRQGARRALAGLVLGRQGTPVQQTAVRGLLNDPEPVVRLRAGQGLLGAHDRAAIPVLIEMLRGTPHPLDWEATELLHWAAGCNGVVTNAMGRPGPPGISLYERWRRWWAEHRAHYQWPSSPEPVQCPRLILVSDEPSEGGFAPGGLWVCGGNGQPYCVFAKTPCKGQMLRGGSALVLAPDSLSERDANGKTRWTCRFDLNGPDYPSDVRPEPDGTITVATRDAVYSLSPEGRVIPGSRRERWSWRGNWGSGPSKLVGKHLLVGGGTYQHPSIWDCDPARPQAVKWLTLRAPWDCYVGSNSTCLQRAGRNLMLIAAPADVYEWDGHKSGLARSPDRTWHLDHSDPAKWRYSRGDAVWDVLWFPGSGLLAVRGGGKLSEVSSTGHNVWEIFTGCWIERAEPVTGVLGLGFRDGDWGRFQFDTVATRLAQLKSTDARVHRAGLLGLVVLVHRGKPLDEALPALAALLRRHDRDGGDVDEILESAGPKSLPYVLPLAKDPDPKMRASALWLVVACHAPIATSVSTLSNGLSDPSPEVQRLAVDGAKRLGRAAAALQTQLRKMVTNRNGHARQDLVIAAARALGQVATDKPAAEAVLRTALTQARDPYLRVAAAEGLAALGPADPKTVRALMAGLRKPTPWEIHGPVAIALARSPADRRMLATAFSRALTRATKAGGQREREVASDLIDALGELGTAAAPATAQLRQIAEDSMARGGFGLVPAVVALGRLGPAGRESLGSLLAGPAGSVPSVRPFIERALGKPNVQPGPHVSRKMWLKYAPKPLSAHPK